MCFDIYAGTAVILEPIESKIEHIDEGENITLRCIGVGYPPPLVQWSKLNGVLSDRVYSINEPVSSNDENVTRVTLDLIFTEACREDSGVYECSVNNLLDDIATNISLIIHCTL